MLLLPLFLQKRKNGFPCLYGKLPRHQPMHTTYDLYGYFVLASPIMVLLYNDRSTTPAHLLMMGAIVVVLYGLSSVTNSILHGLNYMTSPAKNAGVALVIHLAAFVLMMTVFKMNVYALVGGNIVFALAMSILNLIKIRKVSGFRMDLLSTFGKPFTAAAIMGVITYGVFRLFDLLVGGRVLPVLVSLIVADRKSVV